MPDQCMGCGQVNRAGARFCSGCGAALSLRCRSCGSEFAAQARFCDACGAPVSTEAAPVEAGRKTVSVVFSDLAGSTAMQEALDPESVREVMARYYEVMRTVVQRHDGHIEKFIGDAVIAVFGKPVVREDDGLRAVRCAAEMTAGLDALGDEFERQWGVRLTMRTGVNTGELVISGDGIMVGDTMNTAARLEQSAGPGEVFISEATWRLVRHHVIGEEIEPLALKGKSAPVRAWRLLAAEPASTTDAGLPAVEAPLVGREPELGRLRDALDQAIAERTCRLVTVIGSPGLGKSRLAAAFAAGVSPRARVVYGHCEASGEGITFLPVAEVVREVAGISESDEPETVRAKLRALAPEGDPDRDRLVERVAAVIGVADPASAQETFWGLRRGLEAIAGEQPLVVVLEDLHWGQPMLLDLVEHLVEWIADAPVLLLALARPELRESREVLTSIGRRASDVIELEPLGPDHSRALVDGLLGASAELPAELLARILETTEGNPLFLGELVRMLIDDGTLVRSGEAWAVAGGTAAVEVPPTIHALLTARIERLHADERAVVERAAVIGKQFYRGAVAELLAPRIRPTIDGHLEALRRKEMVEPEGIYWIDEPVYRFHHVLIRDAAYRLLLKEARAVLHERFADWLEDKAGEMVGEYEEVIAFHLEQAHAYRRDLGPLDDAGRSLGARAATRLSSAGRRALAREDLAAASNLLARALDCESGDPASILWDLAETLLSAGDVSAAGPVVDRYAEAVAEEERGVFRVAALRGQLTNLTGHGDPAATVASLVAAATALGERDDALGEAKAWAVVAQTNARLGRVGEVEAALDRALTAARKAGDRRRTTAVLAAAPRAALWGPSPVVRASGRCLDVVRILRMTPGNRHVEALALRCQAVLEAMRSRADAAREILAGARATLEELGLSFELNETRVHAGTVELLAGEPRIAVEHLRAARAEFESMGADAAAAQTAALLARALVARGEPGDADAAVDAVGFARGHGGHDLRTAIIALSAHGEALAQRGQIDEALASARRAVELAEPTDALADKADASIALARVLLTAGDRAAAQEAARTARTLYEAKNHTVGTEFAGRLAGAAAEPSATPQPVEAGAIGPSDRAPARIYKRWVELLHRGEIERMLELHAPDFVQRDRRATIAGESLHGRDGARAFIETMLTVSPDFRLEVEEVLAADDRVAVLRGIGRGHYSTGGGEFELTWGNVCAITDGLIQSVEIYEHDDVEAMLARYNELGGRQATVLGDRPPERLLAEMLERFGRDDLEVVLDMYAPDYEVVDRRSTISMETVRGRDGNRAFLQGLLDNLPDIRFDVHDVVACDDRVLAVRMATRGHSREGGTWDNAFGWIRVVEDGLFRLTEFFDFDDLTGMVARYAELGGGLSALGARPPERWFMEFVPKFARHEIAPLLEMTSPDYRFIDHRQLGWEPLEGREGFESLVRSGVTAGLIWLEVDEVYACDDRVIAMTVVYRGRSIDSEAIWELPAGTVAVIENGLQVNVEHFAPDDRAAMLARYAELGGRAASVLGEHPLERILAATVERFDARDIEGMVALLAPDFRQVDHRAIGWDEITGRPAASDFYRSVFETVPDFRCVIDEVLALSERVIAQRCRFVGSIPETGGALEVPLGLVTVVEDGLTVTQDVYESDDREAMLARFAELGGGARASSPVLGDRPLEQFVAEQVRLFNAHDLDGFIATHVDDYVLVDHRTASCGAVSGAEAFREHVAASIRGAPDIRMEIEEVLACDRRVIATRQVCRGHTRLGGGAFEWEIGAITVVENGRCVKGEAYEPEDRQAIVARYVELGGGLSALGQHPLEQFYAEFSRRYARRDIEEQLEMLADDVVLVDHRPLGWEPIHGREGFRTMARSGWEGASDLRTEVAEVLGVSDHVIALTGNWIGHSLDVDGEFSLDVGRVYLVDNGRITSIDQYAPDDRGAMIARYAELGGGLSALGDSPLELLWAEFVRRFARRDIDGLLDLVSEEYVLIDHRLMSWQPARGRAAFRALQETTWESLDVRIEVDEVLAVGEHAIAMLARWTGHTSPEAGGGEFAVPLGRVTTVVDGRITSIDQYEPEDREAMLARFDELEGNTP